jgi:sugar lactone lactonase YvrE
MKKLLFFALVIGSVILLAACGPGRSSVVTTISAEMQTEGMASATFTLRPAYTSTPSDRPTSKPTLRPKATSTTSAPQIISPPNASLLAEVRRLTEHDDNIVGSLAFSPDGKILATAGNGSNIRLWNPNTGELLATLQGHTFNINQLAFSPDGSFLASASSDDTVRIWDTGTHKTVAVLDGYNSDVYTIAFSPDGRWLASGADSGPIQIWDMQTFELARELPVPAAPDSIVFKPDGTTMAASFWGRGQDIYLWSLPDFTQTMTFPTSDAVNELAYSPDGRLLAAAMQSKEDPSVHLLRSDTGEELFILSGAHVIELNDVTFSPDGRLVVSASADSTVAVWDSATGKLLNILRHDSNANYVAFSPDGTMLASAGSDRTVRLWVISAAQVASRPTEMPPPVLAPTAVVSCSVGFSRLGIGDFAQPAGEPSMANRIRSEPKIGDNILTGFTPGMFVKLIDGPVCADGFVFWQVESRFIPGGVGWTAEGDGINYFLEPLK